LFFECYFEHNFFHFLTTKKEFFFFPSLISWTQKKNNENLEGPLYFFKKVEVELISSLTFQNASQFE